MKATLSPPRSTLDYVQSARCAVNLAAPTVRASLSTPMVLVFQRLLLDPSFYTCISLLGTGETSQDPVSCNPDTSGSGSVQVGCLLQ
jgi:hypothetical protein